MTKQADDFNIPMRPRSAEMREADFPRSTTRPPDVAEPARQSSERPVGSYGNEVDRRTLVIGQGIALSGEVTFCDRLIVEGRIEAESQKCRHMIIAESGMFKGHAATENADIYGSFEGGLVVRKRLLIRGGGRVSGTVSYGEIEIEAGGRISGVIEEAGSDLQEINA